MNTVKRIQTEAEHDAALEELQNLVLQNPEEDSPESHRIDVLALIIEEYEKRTVKPELPDPIKAIKFRMEQQGLKQKDLVPILGNKSRMSDVLNRKRALTLPMIRALEKELGIPAKVLIQETKKPNVSIKSKPQKTRIHQYE